MRKSTTMAYLYMSLKNQGKKPLLVALDTNDTLASLLDASTDAFTWDINNQDQSQQNLQAIIIEAQKTEQPIVMDLAALGGGSLGIQTLLDTDMFEVCDLTAFAPIMPTLKSIQEADRALRLLQPDNWVLVQYDTERNQAIYDRTPELQKLEALEPSAIIRPSELTEGLAADLRAHELSLPEIEEVLLKDPIGTLGIRVFSKFWSNLLPQFTKAIKSVRPASE